MCFLATRQKPPLFSTRTNSLHHHKFTPPPLEISPFWRCLLVAPILPVLQFLTGPVSNIPCRQQAGAIKTCTKPCAGVKTRISHKKNDIYNFTAFFTYTTSNALLSRKISVITGFFSGFSRYANPFSSGTYKSPTYVKFIRYFNFSS